MKTRTPQKFSEKEPADALASILLKVKERKLLIQVVNNQLKSLLGYADSAIFLVHQDELALFNFLSEPSAFGRERLFLPVVKASIPWVKPPAEPLLKVRDLKPYLAGEHGRPQRYGLELLLGNNGKAMGRWVMYYGAKENIPQAALEVLPSLGPLVAAAVANVLEWEQMQERERENTIIESLNGDFAAIRDKKDLLKIIQYKLKNLFAFSDQYVALINEEELTSLSFLQEVRPNTKAHNWYQRSVQTKYPLADGILNQVLASAEPQVFDLDQHAAKGYPTEYFQIMHESGVKTVILAGLQLRERIMGLWCICQLAHQFPTANQLQLIKRISSQLSIAVDNIRANEAILAREAEARQLLKLGEDIAGCRDKHDLFRAINRNLKKLFQFEDIVILVLADDGAYYAFLYALARQSAGYPYYQQTSLKKHAHADRCFREAMQSDGIVVLDMEQLYHDEAAPEYIRFEYESGIREKVAVKLRDSHKDIGVFYVNATRTGAYTAHELALIEGVSYQLSVAVSNILASEEIQRREREQSLLLSFSNALASVRDRKGLSVAFSDEIKKFDFIQDYSLRMLSEDKKYHQMFLYDANAHFTKHPDFPVIRDTLDEVNDGVTEVVIQSDKPVTFNVAELNQRQVVPSYVRFWKNLGLVENKGMPVRLGDETIGILWLRLYPNHDETVDPLLQNICFQIAVALSNVLANEKVARREEEKTILLSLSNEIASLKNRNDLFNVVNARIKHIFSITQFGIVAINEDGTTHSAFMLDLGDSVTNQEDFKDVTHLKYSTRDAAFSRTVASDEPVVLDVDELANAADAPPYVQFWQAVGFKQILSLALRVGGQCIGTIFFNIKPDEINRLNNNLLKGICAQLAVAVSNILATEKVLRQLNEINRYKQQLEEEKIYLKEEIATSHNYSEIIGESPAIRKVFRLVEQVAASDSTVLLLGETGTGKELIARAIHNRSPRKDRLMVKVNCATLPANLIESELFGHERGSFTGATERRVGKFELAHHGTLFLDEIGEMPLDLQVKLLRALQEKEIERVGGKHTIQVDVRIIAATNRDLSAEVAEGRFRRDLYYRLNIFPIPLPPLRSRPEDIPLLATHFINRFAKKAGKHIATLGNSAMQELLRYHWPGNIRELEHLMERSILLSTGDTIKHFQLPSPRPEEPLVSSGKEIQLKTIDDNERDHILNVLSYCNGRVSGAGGAAEILGVPKSTLNSKMKRLGIKRTHVKL